MFDISELVNERFKNSNASDDLIPVDEPFDLNDEQFMMQHFIKQECNHMKKLLLEKNEAYGNSAGSPVSVFSRADLTPLEKIDIRLDDKIKRIIEGREYAGEDAEEDIIGYLILKRCLRRLNGTP